MIIAGQNITDYPLGPRLPDLVSEIIQYSKLCLISDLSLTELSEEQKLSEFAVIGVKMKGCSSADMRKDAMTSSLGEPKKSDKQY